MKKIDVFKSYEKVKVSLALEKEVLDLLDEALIGFKLINLLGNNEQSSRSLLLANNESQYKSILNRSDFVSKIIDVISDEKLFLLNGDEYSLKQLSEINSDIAFSTMFDFYISISRFFRVLNIDWLKEDSIKKIKNMSVNETVDFFRNGDPELKLRIKELESNSAKKVSEKESESDKSLKYMFPDGWEELAELQKDLKILDNLEFTSIPREYYKRIFSDGVVGLDDGIHMLQVYESLVIHFDYGISGENLISDLMDRQSEIFSEIESKHRQKSKLKEKLSEVERDVYEWEKFHDSWQMSTIVYDKLEDVVEVIVKNLEDKLSDYVKIKVLRNQLFNEKNEEMINIFDTYLDVKYKLNERRKSNLGKKNDSL